MDWDRIRVFLAVARAGQILGAAQQLGLNHATVGRHLTALEEDLGAKLVQRQTQGCTLTPAGEALEAAGGSISQWRALSADFARGASGEVNAFVGGSRVNSVWNVVEKPILMQNPNVQKIIIQDAAQPWKTTITYK